ncbi:MAG TPA: hypothetical protein VIB79_29680 [Candidatus Binatia bacterium]
MLSIFSVPKPFESEAAVAQRNAIESWRRLHPDCEIILCGDEEGTESSAREFGAKFVRDVPRNALGTPLISAVFEVAERAASRGILCYVNGDIILTRDVISAVRSVQLSEFLMIGRRWDVWLREAWNFNDNWETALRAYVREHGVLHPATGIDYFIYPRGTIGNLPPFAVGRPGWDNWVVYQARARGIPVIDATRAITVVHQNHGYAHVKGATDPTHEGPEADRNRELINGWDKVFDIRDATHRLVPGQEGSCLLRKNWRTVPVPVLRAQKQLFYLAGAGARAMQRHFAS